MILKYLKRKLIQPMEIQNVNVKILVADEVEKQLVSNCSAITHTYDSYDMSHTHLFCLSILFCNYSSPNYQN